MANNIMETATTAHVVFLFLSMSSSVFSADWNVQTRFGSRAKSKVTKSPQAGSDGQNAPSNFPRLGLKAFLADTNCQIRNYNAPRNFSTLRPFPRYVKSI
ncbi:MAG TPA: hypothetical protein VI756_32375 [Blastocatellia bacterium]